MKTSLPTLSSSAHIDARRIGHRGAALEQRIDMALLIQPLELRELRLRIHAERFRRCVGMRRVHRDALGDGMGNDVGQVVLALRIVVRQAREPLPQPMRRSDQDAGVDFAQCAFRRRRVLFLDDAAYPAVTANDAAVAVRIVQQHRQQPDAAPRRHHQPLERCRRNQRHIAVKHQRMRVVGQQRQRLHHRVPGAELRFLQHETDVALGRERTAHGFGTVPDHDDDAGIRLPRGNDACGVDHVR